MFDKAAFRFTTYRYLRCFFCFVRTSKVAEGEESLDHYTSQGHTQRSPSAGGVDRRRQIPDLVSIHPRPPEVEERLPLGHWEGDLIKGAFNRSAVGTLVERVSDLVFLAKMDGATA
jgi:IS30 family transposase